MMEKLGQSFDKDLLEWKQEVEQGVKIEKDVLESLPIISLIFLDLLSFYHKFYSPLE